MAKVAISAGHNPDGKVACGVVAHLNESTENRYVVRQLIKRNKKKGKIDEIVDCTINNAKSQQDHLTRCAYKHLEQESDINIQIHFNSYNSAARGSEILIRSGTTKKKVTKVGKEILYQLSKLGFINRGIKYGSELYMLNHIKDFIIIEVCFADNEEDAHLYNSDKKAVVKAIYKGIWKGLKNAKN